MKRGINSIDWDSLLKELEDKLDPVIYKLVEGILYKHSTDYF